MIKARLPLFLLALFVLALICPELLVQPQPRPGGPSDADAQAAAGVFIGLLVCYGLFMLVAIGVQIWIMVFVYKDATARGENGVLWLLITFFLGLIGLIIWLVVRPKDKKPGMSR